MSFLVDVARWFTTASHWRGDFGVPHRVFEHVAMSGAAIVAGACIALPVGVAIGHTGRGRSLVVNLSNIGRAVPSLAILALAQQTLGLRGWPGFGARPAFLALVALAVPPLLLNAAVGVEGVDEDVRDAARGMGMTGLEMVRIVELPLAAPVIMAGVRTASVQVVATATLAAVTAWGGLGRFIVDGFGQRDNVTVFCGALLVAVLALGTELGLGALQRRLTIFSNRAEEESHAD
jgi:osmoprotectant transport system permease protein